MEEVGGFLIERVPGVGGNLVLLHGSGGDEGALVGFAGRVAPGWGVVAVRGQVAWEGGFAFFRRRGDRSLDLEDLEARCSAFCGFLQGLQGAGGGRPVLVGYSNGAIMAAAAVVRAPGLTAGAVLLRPLSPGAGAFPDLAGYPVLLVGGARDLRRGVTDTPELAGQFRGAGAVVTERVVEAGHGLVDGVDDVLVGEWLAGLPGQAGVSKAGLSNASG